MEPRTILVADDEPSICWAFEKMLSADGHRVITASSAEEGLRLADEHSPDLVVLDVRLPKADGITSLPKFLQVTAHPTEGCAGGFQGMLQCPMIVGSNKS